MKLIAGLVAALIVVGIAGLMLIRSDSRTNSSKFDPTPASVSEVAHAPSPTTESIRPLSGPDAGGKCINPPLNTICVQ
jgi:hypothetical protein